MLQIITRLQWLLTYQLDTPRKPMVKMSDTEWAEYEARNREIDELCKTIQMEGEPLNHT